MSQSTTPKSYARRNVYIEKGFQNKFILKFCSLVAAGAGLTILILYILTRLSTTVSIVKSRVVVMTTADFLLPLLLQTVIIVTVAVVFATAAVTLYVSHKIAGPLFRFKQTFKELSLGNFTNQVRLRKDDQLHEVATEFNQMITAIRSQIAIAQETSRFIQTELDAIGEFNVDENKRRKFVELKLKVQELEKAVHFFRI